MCAPRFTHSDFCFVLPQEPVVHRFKHLYMDLGQSIRVAARSLIWSCIATLLLCTSLQAKTYTAQDSLSVNIQGKNMTIAEIFKVLHQQTGYIVFYSNSILDDQERLDMDFINADIKEVM